MGDERVLVGDRVGDGDVKVAADGEEVAHESRARVVGARDAQGRRSRAVVPDQDDGKGPIRNKSTVCGRACQRVSRLSSSPRSCEIPRVFLASRVRARSRSAAAFATVPIDFFRGGR